jgi:putative restriction endonuclease
MIESLFSLNRAPSRTKANGKAPHKPILLLALIQEIDEGRIEDNKVFITPELIASFKEIWSRLVEGNWSAKFFLPFYHLSNDKPQFWFLKLEPGAQVALTSSYSPKSITALKDGVRYAYFADWLWDLLQNPSEREKLRIQLINRYFPNKVLKPEDVHLSTQSYLKQLELQFVTNTAADKLPKAYRVLEREARCTFFKSRIPEIYHFTCAISRQQITTSDDVQMIDACHIRPWSETKDDSIQNGIALTPTIHRAFDRGIIRINSDYTVALATDFTENENSPFSLKQFEGKMILLPEKKEWWPMVV